MELCCRAAAFHTHVVSSLLIPSEDALSPTTAPGSTFGPNHSIILLPPTFS